jgi:acyl carrier protein
MGLDLVELVFEMEETFGIVFDDLEAEKISTVGQAYRYIFGMD